MPADAFLDAMPLLAILRGVTPDRVVAVGDILFANGVRAIEVPLNSPDPFKSIERLCARFGDTCLCGAGTVLAPADVDRTRAAGGSLIVSPNTNPAVIARACALGMIAMPGFATATEAFQAIDAGATRLKLFPAASYGPAHLKALGAVLPRKTYVYAVGGVGAGDIALWVQASAAGFGFGSDVFKPDYSIDEIGQRAKHLVEATKRAFQKE